MGRNCTQSQNKVSHACTLNHRTVRSCSCSPFLPHAPLQAMEVHIFHRLCTIVATVSMAYRPSQNSSDTISRVGTILLLFVIDQLID